MAIIEEGTCKIQKINHKGMGVSSSAKGEVEVPYALPGELISFQRHTYRHKSNCCLVEVLEESTARQKAACQYFGRCGGCLLQHFKENDYTALKIQMLEAPLAKYKIQTKINSIITVPPANRRRANFEAFKKEDSVNMGFHKFHSNQIVDINNCPVLLPALSDVIMPIKEVLNKILSHKQKSQIFVTYASNGIDITLEIYKQPRLNDLQREHLKDFAKENNIIKLIFRAKKFIEVLHQTQEPYVLFDDIKVDIDAHCFLQSSFESDRILQELITKHALAFLPDLRAVDLFCGRGTYTLPLSKLGKVDGFESDAKALEALSKAAKSASRDINLTKQDLFTSPVQTSLLNKYNFAVINPPRAGAKEQILELSQSTVESIVYISCNPETFAQDAQMLVSNNYQLVESTPFDQFYWSPHLEVIGIFKRIG